MKITGGVDKREAARIAAAMELYREATGKDMETTLNRFMRNVAIYASAKTPKVEASKIASELRRVVGHQIAGKTGKRLKKPREITKPTRLARAILVARLRRKGEAIPTSDEIEARAEKMIRSRMRGAGFHRAGYIPALQAFGAPTSKAKAKTFGPAKGEAKVATGGSLRAQLANFAGAIDKVGRPAFDAAIREARIDMETYAKDRLAKRTAAANRQIAR